VSNLRTAQERTHGVSSYRAGTRLAAAGAGLLAAGAGVATSSVVAAAFTGVPSPLVSVGTAVIDLAPPAVEDFAIEQFGTADKPVLLGGILTVIALIAAGAGLVGLRRPQLALVITALLGLLAILAAATDRTSLAAAPVTILPAVVALVVSIGALAWMLSAHSHRTGADVADWGHPHPGDDVGADFDRRKFLEAVLTTGGVAAIAGVGAGFIGPAEAIASRAEVMIRVPDSPAPVLPAGTQLPVNGITPHLTRSADFYRIDTALTPPDVPAGGWSLRIHGMVDEPFELDYAGLLERRLVERRVTLVCVSNEVGGDLAGNATWVGVPMRDLLDEAGVQSGADAVLSTSADGFTAGTPLHALTDGRDAMVAVAMNGAPLPIVHGFPARMVVPGLYGFVSATKWLTDIEVTSFANFSAYWTERGWAEQAPIKTASRIDVPASFAQLPPGEVAVAGVAWAPHRGIDRVEVRVDGLAWNEARLAAADGVDTWRQWVWQWTAEPGTHALEVRATDSSGAVQTSEQAQTRPDGATGYHRVEVTVT